MSPRAVYHAIDAATLSAGTRRRKRRTSLGPWLALGGALTLWVLGRVLS